MSTTSDVLAGRARWSVEQADCREWLRSLPDGSIDLLITSPPYEAARLYGELQFSLRGQDWVDWMVSVIEAAAPKVKGLIAVNCEGQTRGYRYSCTPFLLMADLHRKGFNLRKPPIFHRVGIPGSGGPDWLRNDYEPIICITRPGQLPWSDNTACGHPPKWAPGGEMANRLADGSRVNQWGMRVRKDGSLTATEPTKDGAIARRVKPSHRIHTKREADGEMREQHYDAPAVANPGNVIKCNVGGGQMGHTLAHENEAPFPLELPAFFVKSFCPPDGVVCDPFSGSGTTMQAAVENGRRFVGCDIRDTQVHLAQRRITTVTPDIFSACPS